MTTNNTTERKQRHQGTVILLTPRRKTTIGTNATRMIRSFVATCTAYNRISFRQMAPDENHGGTGSGAQQHAPARYWFARSSGISDLKTTKKNNEAMPNMVNGFISIDHQVTTRPFGFFHVDDAGKIDLQHHRVNHQPDKNRHRNRNVGVLEPSQEFRNRRQKLADEDTVPMHNITQTVRYFSKKLMPLLSVTIILRSADYKQIRQYQPDPDADKEYPSDLFEYDEKSATPFEARTFWANPTEIPAPSTSTQYPRA